MTRRPEIVLALALHGYRFSTVIRRHARPADPDVVPVRFLGRPALLVAGPEGVRFFTDTSVFRRRDATPHVVADVLFGRGAVHGLDGADHEHRKQLFVRATGPAAVVELVTSTGRRWREVLADTPSGRPVTVQRLAEQVIGSAVTAWAGVPASSQSRATPSVVRDLAAEVDGFGVLGPANVAARLARRRTNAWAAAVVEEQRRTGTAPEGSALAIAAAWTGADGSLLPAEVAGVELQNLLRPTIAVSRFVAFGVLALTLHPQWRTRLREENDGLSFPGRDAMAFAHEVRRLTPFVPLLAARADRDATFHGQPVPRGSRVALDVMFTLRDRRHWHEPQRFDPERFLGGQDLVADALVPQGGGSVVHGHRCPGEEVTLGILAASLAEIASADWRLPPQDLSVALHRVPTAPASGIRLVPSG
ncbi:MAG: cytochrome P450 [Dermatophilaceae bacterium]